MLFFQMCSIQAVILEMFKSFARIWVNEILIFKLREIVKSDFEKWFMNIIEQRIYYVTGDRGNRWTILGSQNPKHFVC